MNNNNTTIPEESNVYRKICGNDNSTPSGSHIAPTIVFYKHAIPPGLETEIQNNLKGLGFENLSPR